jgi:hypothetical protein
MLKNFFLSLLLTLIVFGLFNQKTVEFIKRVITFNQVNATTVTYIILGIFVFVITFIMLGASEKKKENFFFEVSKNLPRCRNGFIGKPTSFDFSTYDDRVSTCESEKEIEKDPHFGWDGMVNQTPATIVGGCDYNRWSGMQRF